MDFDRANAQVTIPDGTSEIPQRNKTAPSGKPVSRTACRSALLNKA
jgi:hypothetical protein